MTSQADSHVLGYTIFIHYTKKSDIGVIYLGMIASLYEISFKYQQSRIKGAKNIAGQCSYEFLNQRRY